MAFITSIAETASAFWRTKRWVTVRYSVRDDLFGLLADGLLTDHEALTLRPGGDQMQRLATLAARMDPPRGFASMAMMLGPRLRSDAGDWNTLLR